ncbi:hypothetical protein LEP1GSC016_4205 [Leptospira borgpetersenii serovar Hardjo-bovis str. Sponselee]|uniref:Uncharacterized protein n=1 Tax=Leptospira borgpetersenii serovar Hardjo-bovis str. Sponselee TaxID=1303729 RepID=M6BF83_LEPBO|nr:hypothetical protein LEP1GSC016_4205 [Leptospira borgpetersenii serovar Hardjo-bovis str. Sponselee]
MRSIYHKTRKTLRRFFFGGQGIEHSKISSAPYTTGFYLNI